MVIISFHCMNMRERSMRKFGEHSCNDSKIVSSKSKQAKVK